MRDSKGTNRMNPILDDGDVVLYAGDCIDVMRELSEASVDAIVTDPPYELGFMSKSWDGTGIAYRVEMWEAALRVLKPGGHLLAFSGTRTYHRMVVAIEDAGFEIRDCIAWMYGSGFPKSLDVSKAIDKKRYDRDDIYTVTAWIRSARNAAGITNRDIDKAFGFSGMAGHWTSSASQPAVPTLDQVPQLLDVLGVAEEDVPSSVRRLLWDLNGPKGQPGENWARREVVGDREVPVGHAFAGATYGGDSSAKRVNVTTPATDAAREWVGWGTALKPAFEPVVVARKPLIGTVAENVQTHGTGALNINACRIAAADSFGGGAKATSGFVNGYERGEGWQAGSALGRWPANVALDETAASILDEQSGASTSRIGAPRSSATPGDGWGMTRTGAEYDDTGGASRFFYTAKASRQDRNAGGLADNTHPTVKPTDLMRWLIRLVTPPGGVILDPFAGSGSTGLAARAENVRCILIEREAEYQTIIRDRLAQLSLFAQAAA